MADYARKWFALEEGAHVDEADAFLAESESVPDLRTNPLLLSLMCILYRGEGSLPRNRAEVYEQCANLLFRRWDARRRIHQELRAGHLIEPTLRHLAWWLFTRDNTQTAVTERELIVATTSFLHGRGFESETDARDAACEFIEFCRGRMWVFCEAGTTADGEKLFSFTHRTFLEYFAASHLAYDSDTPEKLASILAPHIARSEWEVVSELSVQIKDRTSALGAQRVYETLLNERRRRAAEGRGNILQFLARALRSVEPSPQMTRRLTRDLISFMFSGDPDDPIWYIPLARLLTIQASSLKIVSEEVLASIAEMISSADSQTRLNGLRLAISLDRPGRGIWHNGEKILYANPQLLQFWTEITAGIVRDYSEQVKAEAPARSEMRIAALTHDLMTIEQAFEMPGGLRVLMESDRVGIFSARLGALLIADTVSAIYWSQDSTGTADSLCRLSAAGRYIAANPAPPWVHGMSRTTTHGWSKREEQIRSKLDPITSLGGIAVLLIMFESNLIHMPSVYLNDPALFGPFTPVQQYCARRLGESTDTLPDLPVPDEFKQLFRDWADGKMNFTTPAPGSPGQNTA